LTCDLHEGVGICSRPRIKLNGWKNRLAARSEEPLPCSWQVRPIRLEMRRVAGTRMAPKRSRAGPPPAADGRRRWSQNKPGRALSISTCRCRVFDVQRRPAANQLTERGVEADQAPSTDYRRSFRSTRPGVHPANEGRVNCLKGPLGFRMGLGRYHVGCHFFSFSRSGAGDVVLADGVRSARRG